MSIKKSVFTKKKIILILLIVTAVLILVIHKVSVTNQLKERKLYNKEVLTKFNKKKKGYEHYLKQLNLKSDKLNYLQKLRDTHSESELLHLIKTAKVKSENNIKNDGNPKEQAIEKSENSSKGTSLSSSELKDNENTAALVSSIPSSLEERESTSQISKSSQVKSSVTVKPSIQRTDGLNFNGEHYDIKGFSGLGHVPVDEYIYQWLDYTEHLHLLAERQSPVGRDVRELAIGSKVIVNNQTYTIFNIITGVANDENTYNSLSNGQPALTIQSCDSADENSTLTIWYVS